MKHPEYDSPFELTISDITTQMARNIDEMSWQAVQRVGINVDKEKLLIALKQDAERYREAYANGYDTGYTKRDEEIVRCRDCKYRPTQTEPPKTYGFSIEFPEGSKCPCQCDDGFYSWYPADNWYCADGERSDGDE